MTLRVVEITKDGSEKIVGELTEQENGSVYLRTMQEIERNVIIASKRLQSIKNKKEKK